MRVPWTARRSNQSILKETSPEYSLEGLMLKLKLQYFGHLMRTTDSFERPWCWERLRAGGEGDDRGWDGWMVSLTQWTWIWVNSRSWWWTGKPGMLQSMGSPRVGHDWATKLNLTESVSQLPPYILFVYLLSSLTIAIIFNIYIGLQTSSSVLQLSCSWCKKLKTISRDFPDSPVVKSPTCNAGDMGSIPSQGTKILHAAE